ncbi:MAG: RING finger protein, partial [Pirellulaceae bacterium]
QLSLGGWFHQPHWPLQYGETFVRLTTYTVGRGASTTRMVELIAQFPDSCCRLEVFPRSADTSLLSLPMDLAPVLLAGDDFASAWTILASDEAQARVLLSQQVRFHLHQLRRTPEWSDVSLSIRTGWLVLRRKWTSQRPADLETFVELALGLVDQIQLTRTIGIDFVEEGQVKVIDDARCLVCGEGLVIDLVYCRRCKTPHHRECWDFSGGCSTYGCRETQFLIPHHLPPAEGAVDNVREEPLWPRPGKPR